jgi:hypothetical protein
VAVAVILGICVGSDVSLAIGVSFGSIVVVGTLVPTTVALGVEVGVALGIDVNVAVGIDVNVAVGIVSLMA